MNAEIDEATGLPKVLSAQWWEVRKSVERESYTFGGGYHTIKDGYEVCLMTKKVIPASVRHKDHWWWTRPEYVPERVIDHVVMSRKITDPAKYKEWVEAGTSSLSIYRRVGKVDIGPEDVLKAAKDIVDDLDRQAKQAAIKAASEKMIGKYPPMTISPHSS